MEVDLRDILSAGEESIRLGHLVSVLELGADFPRGSKVETHDSNSDRSVSLPIGRLRVPTTRR